MKKPKRRYEKPSQIHEAIDRYQEKVKLLEADALRLEQEAWTLRERPEMIEDMKFKLEQAKKSRRAADRICEKRLPYLKGKLAELETNLLPGVIADGDVSIPA